MTSDKHSEQGGPARALLLHAQHAALSTQSQELPGYPFGSVVPYCLDAGGCPAILISALALHTRNLKADPRASLLVLAPGVDVQANARLTLLGHFVPVPAADIEALAERYYRFFPQSRDHHRTLDFSFWVMQPQRARFIAGFAGIHWVEPARLLLANPFAGAAEGDIVAHMNEDHAEALGHYWRRAGFGLLAGEAPAMVGIDAEGIHLRLGERLERITFAHAVTTPGQARAALVDMARAGKRGSLMGLLLALLPPAEILLSIKLAQRFGWAWVLLGWAIGFVLGRGLIRWRGRRFYAQAMAAVQRNEMPSAALLGGIAWYVAGFLFMLPGFITDLLALLVLLPPVQRRLLARFGKLAEARIVGMNAQGGFSGFAGNSAGGGFGWPPAAAEGEIIDVEPEPVEPAVLTLEAPKPPADL